jgi:hypothetical protein
MKEAPIRMHVYHDAEEVATEVAAWLHHLASASTGRFSICLSRGRAVKALMSAHRVYHCSHESPH